MGSKKAPPDLSSKIESVLKSSSVKKYIDNSVVYKSSDEIEEGDMEPIVTRFPSFNLMLGIGGLPRGKIMEISGEEGGYKSAVAWAIVGDIQAMGDIAVWIDAENAIDLRIPKVRKFLRTLGVDPNNVIIARPETAEEAFQILKGFAMNPNISLIVFDSIVALSNIREEKADITKEDRNTLPMTINKGLRKTAKLLRNTDCTLILINQLRENMDRRGPYDKKWKTTGGKGLNHWCSFRLYAYKSKIKNADKEHIGNIVNYVIEKTRFSVPTDPAKMFYYFNKGFDVNEELIDLCVAWGVLERDGNSYVYGTKHKMSRKEWISYVSKRPKVYGKLLEVVTRYYDEYFDSANIESDVDEDYDNYEKEED